MNKTKPNAHTYVIKRLSAYLDRQLPERERERIQAHLEVCPDCQNELETLLWTRRLLRQLPTQPVPRSFVVRQSDVERPSDRFAIQWGWARWATGVVALLLVLVFMADAWTANRLMMQSAAPPPQLMAQKSQPVEPLPTLPVAEKSEFGIATIEVEAVPDGCGTASEQDTNSQCLGGTATKELERSFVFTETEQIQTLQATAPETHSIQTTLGVTEAEPQDQVGGQGPPPPVLPSRLGWRLAEMGLGAALVVLTIIWWSSRRIR